MSSTNRGAERNRDDYYLTPRWAINQFLEALEQDSNKLCAGSPLIGGGITILDPCAGGDAENDMAYPAALRSHAHYGTKRLATMDIRADSRAEVKGSYLQAQLDYEPDIIITNPPFNLALPIIRKALADVRPGGLVVMLLRLNFFGSKERKEFMQNHGPSFCYVHSKRIGFTPDGKTDSIEYAHFVWQSGAIHRFTKLRVI